MELVGLCVQMAAQTSWEQSSLDVQSRAQIELRDVTDKLKATQAELACARKVTEREQKRAAMLRQVFFDNYVRTSQL